MKGIFVFSVAGWIPVVVAQVTSTTPDISGVLTGSAVTILGTAVIAFVRGWIVPGAKYDQLQTKYDNAIEEIRQINRDNQAVFIPTIIRAADLIAKLGGDSDK